MNRNQFNLDTRFPPPQGPPGYMSRLYRSDLRPAIIFVAFLGALWSLVSGISSFRNVPLFNNSNETSLRALYIIFGSFFICVGVIECFGIFAVVSRRLAAVRSFAYLSVLATLLIAAAYIIQTVAHYTFKNDIIDLCTNSISGDRIFFTGFFGPIDGGIVTPFEASEWCNQQFNRDSFSNIVALLVITAIFAIFALFVFAYLRQLRDPASAANATREPARTVYPEHYNPYNPSDLPVFYQYPAPIGPPPIRDDRDKFTAPPPVYEGDGYTGGDQKGLFGEQKDPYRESRIGSNRYYE